MAVKINVGDIYIRHSDERVYRVKNIDNKMVVLETENGQPSLTNIFGLEKGYSKKESKPIPS